MEVLEDGVGVVVRGGGEVEQFEKNVHALICYCRNTGLLNKNIDNLR
jgi:hypothetical protein